MAQAALRKQTDGHAMDQGLPLEQARLWPLPCVFYFLSVFHIFWNPDVINGSVDRVSSLEHEAFSGVSSPGGRTQSL